MAPCGTPALISIDDEEKPSIMVIWWRSDKKLLIQANAEPRIPAASILTRRPSCQTRSNAFFRSEKKELQRKMSCQSACSNLGRVSLAEGLFRHPSWIQIACHVAKSVRMGRVCHERCVQEPCWRQVEVQSVGSFLGRSCFLFCELVQPGLLSKLWENHSAQNCGWINTWDYQWCRLHSISRVWLECYWGHPLCVSSAWKAPWTQQVVLFPNTWKSRGWQGPM